MSKTYWKPIKTYENMPILKHDEEVRNISFELYVSRKGQVGWIRLDSPGKPLNPQGEARAISITEDQIARILFQMSYGVHTPVDDQKIQRITENNRSLISRVKRDCMSSK